MGICLRYKRFAITNIDFLSSLGKTRMFKICFLYKCRKFIFRRNVKSICYGKAISNSSGFYFNYSFLVNINSLCLDKSENFYVFVSFYILNSSSCRWSIWFWFVCCKQSVLFINLNNIYILHTLTGLTLQIHGIIKIYVWYWK